MKDLEVLLKNIPKTIKFLMAAAVVLFFGPGIVKALYEIGLEVGEALSYWI